MQDEKNSLLHEKPLSDWGRLKSADMIKRLKQFAVSILERHPYGYALGLAILESHAFFLPHEADFYAMPLVARSGSGLFLDIGANRGHSALSFQKIMPGWQTLSIEANPLHEARLEDLKQRHKFFSYHIAAADRVSGKAVTIWTPRYRGIYCHSAAAVERAKAVWAIEIAFPAQAPNFEYVPRKTRTLALDDLDLAPQLVKLDIEGNEVDALGGLTKTIDLHRPSFMIECNREGDHIFDSMRDLHYVSFSYDQSQHRLVRMDQAPTEGRNLFFIPAERAGSV
jgi:FkbM family methyltransferase